MKRDRLLPSLLALMAATLVHHVHNALFIAQYPNLPAWITPPVVYSAWLGATAVGTAGYLLLGRGYRRCGIGLLALYACYGLESLLHYARAPLLDHTIGMNATIGIEAAAGAALLAACAHAARKTWSVPVSSSGRPSP